jgi:predicted helicase
MTTIHDILRELDQYATDNRDKGDMFERLIVGFLKIDPHYAAKYSDVWLWSDWPGRNGKPDTGIDIVAQEHYQVTTDKDSGIVNDPNDWLGDPLYIVNLIKRLVRVSVETVKIVNALP